MKKFKNSYLSYFLIYSFYYLSWALFSALISVYLMGKGFKASEVSIVVSMSFFTSMLTQPLIGRLNERKNYKTIDSVLFVIAIIGAIAFMLSDSFVAITLSYSLVLVVLNGINPVLEKVATSSPFQYGKIRIWGTIGYALGSQLAGILYDKISPSSIFIVFIFTVLLCILGLLNTEPDMPVTAKKEKKGSASSLLRNKTFLYYLLICTVFYGVTNMSNTFIPTMLVHEGLSVDVTSTILSLAVFCEAPLILFSHKFMDQLSNKTLLLISVSMVFVQCAVYGFHLPLPLILIATFIAKHPAGMLYIMINLKVINTIVDKEQQIEALALVSTLKNLVAIIFQYAAGRILDVTSYGNLYLICTVFILVDLFLVIFYRIAKGTDRRLFS